MEVTSTSSQGPIQPRRQTGDDRIDITKVNREGIHDATEDIAEIRAPVEPYSVRMRRQATETGTTHGDRIELSDEAKQMLAREAGAARPEAAHDQRLAELRQQYLEGKLNTPERVARAAIEMLSQS